MERRMENKQIQDACVFHFKALYEGKVALAALLEGARLLI